MVYRPFCPLGALTSKPYAFVARPWELEAVDSFDFLDSCGAPLSLGVRGGELLRILPRSTPPDLWEGWLADRSRFSYDALRRQRLTQPLSKFLPSDEGQSLSETDLLRPLGWPQALNQLAALLGRSNPLPLVGPYFSLESALALRRFMVSHSSRWTSALWQSSPSPDSRSAFLLPPLLFGEVDLVVLVSLAPRLQLPLLNLHLRRLVQGGLTCFSFGQNHPSTFSQISLGNSPSQLVRFLEGRHRLSVPFALARHPLLLADPSLPLPPLLPHLASIQMAETNAPIPSPSLPASAANFLWLFDQDGVVADPATTPIVYQGSHGDRGAALAHLLLPTPSPFETVQSAYNCRGSLVRQTSPLPSPAGARPHWAILAALGVLLGHPSSFPLPSPSSSLPPPLPLPSSLCPFRLPLHFPLGAPLSNHYLDTAFGRSSAVMALASGRLSPPSSFFHDHA